FHNCEAEARNGRAFSMVPLLALTRARRGNAVEVDAWRSQQHRGHAGTFRHRHESRRPRRRWFALVAHSELGDRHRFSVTRRRWRWWWWGTDRSGGDVRHRREFSGGGETRRLRWCGDGRHPGHVASTARRSVSADQGPVVP